MNRDLFKAKRKSWKELPKEEWWVEGYLFDDGTLKHRRSAKEMKRDREDHFADLAEHEPTENAKKWMQRGAYSVEDCLRKWGVDTKGSVASGQEDTD